MKLKDHLIETFLFNDTANKNMLKKIHVLPSKTDSIKYFSHLINSQGKWLARIQQYPKDPGLDWWLPVYDLNKLEEKWDDSLHEWLIFIETKTEKALMQDVKFIGFDGSVFAAPLKDIALQLNYHSIHHRAQMQLLIRSQGIEPDFIDYIGTKYKKVNSLPYERYDTH